MLSSCFEREHKEEGGGQAAKCGEKEEDEMRWRWQKGRRREGRGEPMDAARRFEERQTRRQKVWREGGGRELLEAAGREAAEAAGKEAAEAALRMWKVKGVGRGR
jgi:hypothetical protein